MLAKAFSISVDAHMCWSDFRNIFRFPLKAEVIYISIQIKGQKNVKKANEGFKV